MAWTRTMTVALAWTLGACGGADAPATDAPTDAPPPPEEPEPKPPPAEGLPTPEALYAECQTRVENPQQDAECTTDADCAKGGCSGEVCTTKEAVAGLTTTCEDKLCFKVLDTCGCVEGVCSWALLDALPDNAVPVERPEGGKPKGSLPPTTDKGQKGDKKKRGKGKKKGE